MAYLFPFLASKHLFFTLHVIFDILKKKSVLWSPGIFKLPLKYEHKFYQGILLAVLEGQIIQWFAPHPHPLSTFS